MSNITAGIPQAKPAQSHTIDILKFICAIMVVQAHTPSLLMDVLAPVIRIAVPIFFMISGYFLGFAFSDSPCRYKHIFLKVLKITVLANLVFLAAGLINPEWAPGGDPANYFKPANILKLLLYGRFISFHLWYLGAYLQAILLFWLLSRIKWNRFYMALCAVGIAANLLLGSYAFLILDGPYEHHARLNLLLMAVPYILLGSLVRRYESRIPLRTLLIMLPLIVAMVYIEPFLVGSTIEEHLTHDTIFTILLTVTVFAVCVRMKDLQVGRMGMAFATLGRKYSAGLYILHPLVYWILISLISAEFMSRYGTALVIAVSLLALILLQLLLTPIKQLKATASARLHR